MSAAFCGNRQKDPQRNQHQLWSHPTIFNFRILSDQGALFRNFFLSRMSRPWPHIYHQVCVDFLVPPAAAGWRRRHWVQTWELGGEGHWACAPCGTDGPDYSESRRETRLCEMATMMNSRFSHLHKVQTQSKGAQRWHWKMFQVLAIYLLDVNIDHNCIYKLLQTRTMTIKHCIFLVWLLSKIRLITWRCDFGIVSYEST